MKELPSLAYDEWSDTLDTLHRWTQVVGKVRLALTPTINHWWNVPLYVSSHGLTTSAIPIGDRSIELEFDFVDDVLRIRGEAGPDQIVELRPRSVADFYAATMAALDAAGVDCRIWTTPVEIADPIPFEHDTMHHAYDREYVTRFWHILTRTEAILTKFRSGFIGKCSPVHFFWGSFDLAVTRFSGRRAPPFEANAIEREAYSHEVSSAGWWPGDQRMTRPAFYSYAAPEPPGFADAQIGVEGVYYLSNPKGFYLDYDDVRRASDPDQLVVDFFNATYAAAADLGAWPRDQLERQPEEQDDHLYPSSDPREQSAAHDRL